MQAEKAPSHGASVKGRIRDAGDITRLLGNGGVGVPSRHERQPALTSSARASESRPLMYVGAGWASEGHGHVGGMVIASRTRDRREWSVKNNEGHSEPA